MSPAVATPAHDRQTFEPNDGQLEAARQLRDLLRQQLVIARAIGHESVALTMDDAFALERLLSDSLDAAERLRAA